MASTYSESTSGTLDFYNQAVQDLINQGQTALTTAQAGTAPQQQVAGFNPLQTQAFGLAQTNLGNWQPAIQGGLGALGSATAASQFDPNQLNQYLNPYLGGVIDEISRLGNRNFNENIAPSIANQFGGLGQYGSARQAMALGKAGADTQANILGQQSNSLMEAYNNAFKNYGDFANLQAGTNLDAAKTYGTLGTTQNQLGVTDYGTLLSAGQAQQQQAQTELNTATQNQAAQQQYPWEQLNNWKNLFGVSTPQQSSSWSTQLKEGGLVGLADGGTPPEWELINDQVRSEQPLRDELRRRVLMSELMDNPNDPNLLQELAFEGVDINPLPVKRDPPPVVSRDDIDMGSGVDYRKGLIQDLISRRMRLADKVNESFKRPQEPGELLKVGRAMLESAAGGPANYGQLLGRAGQSYFGNEDSLLDKQNSLEAAKLGLEDKILPDVGSLGSSSGVERFKFMRGKDGTIWAVSDLNPTRRHIVQPGNYQKEIVAAAERAADNDLKDAAFDTSSQKAAARSKLVDYYSNIFAEHFSGPTEDEDIMSSEIPATSRSFSRPPTLPSSPLEEEFGPRPSSGMIQTPQEVKEGEKIGAGMGEAYQAIQNQAKEAQDQQYYYDQLDALLGKVNTGKLTPLGTEISAWVKAAGVSKSPDWINKYAPYLSYDFEDRNLGNKQAAMAIGNQLALQLRNPAGGAGMPGALSDKDREFLVKSVPGLATSPEGVQALIRMQRKMTQRAEDVARLAREYRKENPRKTFDEGFYEKLSQWSKENPLFSSDEIKSIRATRPKRSLDEIMKEYGDK